MEGLIYLDNSATAFPKPKEVYDFMFDFYKNHGVSPGRSGYDMCIATEETVYATRKMLAEFFNGDDPNRLTFNYNASDSLNMIVDGTLSKGDHVITSTLEHNSVLRPLYHKTHDGVIEVTYVPFDKKGYINPDDVKKAFRKNTKMVILNHASNVIGTVQPIAEVGKYCRKAGILFAIDASQSAGIVKIDMKAMNIDMLAFTGHKCLMGPTGIGGLCIADHVDIKASRFGGTGVRSAHSFHLDEFPYRMECGTQNIIGIAGLLAGQKWLKEKGIENVHKQEISLWDKLRKELQKIENVITYCADNKENQIAVLSFNIKGIEAAEVGTMLDVDHNIACRTGLQCAPLVHEQLGTDKIHGTVRFGIGPFNTEEHINTAIDAVKEIASISKK
ncbi:MAG: aminotransferase class V-fold PLP-dependent enzyme [Bacteroidales bacterium]